MSEILPTVKVKHKQYKIEMVINEKDFDKNIHEIVTVKTNKKEEKTNAEDDLKKLVGVGQ